MEAVLRQISTVRSYQDALFGPFELFPRTPENDRFDFSFCYCGKQMTWNILYDLSNLSFAPDFIIPTEPETLYVPLSQFQTFQKFDANNPESLLLVLYELLNFYKDFQKEQVKDYANERVQFQYSVIESDHNTLFLLDKAEAEIRFMIPLGLDVAAELGPEDFPILDKKNAPAVLLPYLLLTFKDTYPNTKRGNVDTKGFPEVKLLTPPVLERLMSRMPKLPLWTESTVTMDYLEQIRELVKSFLNSVKSRKKFLLACMTTFGSPLEYDSFLFSKISFFFNEIEAVAHFAIPDSFPVGQPAIMLQSVTAMKGANNSSNSSNNSNNLLSMRPVQVVFDAYPYSPRWSADELCKRIRTFLLEKKFKDFCAEEASKEEKTKS